MHELGATERLLAVALEEARAAEASRVTDLYVVIGELSTMAPEAVRHYLDELAPGTAAEGATLHVREVVAELECPSCGRRRRADVPSTGCPGCGDREARVVAGYEFYLEGIDVQRDGGSPSRG